MKRVLFSASGLVVLLFLGVSSATTLGSFPDIVLSGTVSADPTCTAVDVELQDALGNALDLGLASTVEQVEIVGLDGACAGAVPNVIVLGFPFGSVDEQVLVVQGLPPISPSGTTVTAAVAPATDLASIVDGLNLITEVRVVFSPN